MAICAAFVSGKGGTGKSTLCAGLGCALAAKQRRVLVLELDAGFRCLDLLLGVADRLVFDLNDVLRGKPVEEAALHPDACPTLSLLAAPQDEPVLCDALPDFLRAAAAQYDALLFDFAAGWSDALALLPAGTKALVVATPDDVALRDATVLARRLPAGLDGRIVLNRFSVPALRRSSYPNLDRVVDLCGLPLAGLIPFDDTLAAARGSLRKSPARLAFTRLAARFEGNAVPLPGQNKFRRSFL